MTWLGTPEIVRRSPYIETITQQRAYDIFPGGTTELFDIRPTVGVNGDNGVVIRRGDNLVIIPDHLLPEILEAAARAGKLQAVIVS
jgi:hypothetical protein